MSKVVKAVGNAVGNVVKGAVKIVSKIGQGVGGLVKSIASSKLGKAVLIAAAIYFGGAALSGGFGASASGGSFLSGMGTGVSNAASSLSTAWGSAMSGEFSTAGSQLAQGFSGEVATVPSANPLAGNYSIATEGAAATPPAPGTPPAPSAPAGTTNALTGNYGAGGATDVATNAAQTTAANAAQTTAAANTTAATPGTWSKIMASPYTAPSLISGGMQVGGAYIQGKAQEKQLQDQRAYEQKMAQEARDRYNANAGAQLFAADQSPIYQAAGPAWDPYAEARARAAQRYAPQPTGVVARYMPPVA